MHYVHKAQFLKNLCVLLPEQIGKNLSCLRSKHFNHFNTLIKKWPLNRTCSLSGYKMNEVSEANTH